MHGWKRGVEAAQGEFIAFCDADDYIDEDMIEKLVRIGLGEQVDMVLCGLQQEYADGKRDRVDNDRSEGRYNKEQINEVILKNYYQKGRMESRIVLASRDTKLFRRSILKRVMNDLNNDISLGEDDLTTFATISIAESLYCMKNFFPYHYVRNDQSMIGHYDSKMFSKILNLREEMYIINRKRGNVLSTEQIEEHFMSNTILCAKKEICRNNGSYKLIKNNLKQIRNNETLCDNIKTWDYSGYEIKSKFFSFLFIHRFYFVLFILTKCMNMFGVGRA